MMQISLLTKLRPVHVFPQIFRTLYAYSAEEIKISRDAGIDKTGEIIIALQSSVHRLPFVLSLLYSMFCRIWLIAVDCLDCPRNDSSHVRSVCVKGHVFDRPEVCALTRFPALPEASISRRRRKHRRRTKLSVLTNTRRCLVIEGGDPCKEMPELP